MYFEIFWSELLDYIYTTILSYKYLFSSQATKHLVQSPKEWLWKPENSPATEVNSEGGNQV